MKKTILVVAYLSLALTFIHAGNALSDKHHFIWSFIVSWPGLIMLIVPVQKWLEEKFNL